MKSVFLFLVNVHFRAQIYYFSWHLHSLWEFIAQFCFPALRWDGLEPRSCCSAQSVSVCYVLQLQMLGYDVSWAAFNIVEVMSSSKFTYKVWLECRYISWQCLTRKYHMTHLWCLQKLRTGLWPSVKSSHKDSPPCRTGNTRSRAPAAGWWMCFLIV